MKKLREIMLQGELRPGYSVPQDNLKQQPNSGQIEPNLEILMEGHRYLVTGNYKVVYKKVNEGILITDIFDTRQDPSKINNPERKPGR